MKQQCAWCGKELGLTGNPSDHLVSHGICNDCADAIMNFKLVQMREFVEKFPDPVLMVDDDVVVITANDRVRRILNKTESEMEAFRGGQVLECIHSAEPGGCGRTLHCAGCVIRNSINETVRTGHGVCQREAFQDIITPKGRARVRIVISTEKIGDKILLKIESIRSS